MMGARTSMRGLALLGLGCALFLLGLAFFLWQAGNPLPATAGKKMTPGAGELMQVDRMQRSPAAPMANADRLADERAMTRPARSFDSYLQELVDLGCELWQRVESEDEAGATEIDAELRRLYRELTQHLPATDELALSERGMLPAQDQGVRGQVLRQLLNRLIRDGLAERWEKGMILGQRNASDHLARAMLLSIAKDALIATDLGLDTLADGPYLGAAQEREVMDLIELSVEEEFLVPVASALLLTTWKNMEERGERSSSGIDSLALILKDDSNPARRLAALEHLLASGSENLIRLVLDLAGKRGDRALARQLAHCAANKLEPELALRVLSELVDLAGEELVSPFMILATRDSAAVQAAYEQRLGDLVDARVRAELITGCGFSGSPESIDLAETAFNQDPDPEVLSRALFVLSAKAKPALAEEYLARALDDPRIATDSGRIGSLVLCLQNLGKRGAYNSLSRIAERIRVLPQLLPQDRREMDRILQRFLPQRAGEKAAKR